PVRGGRGVVQPPVVDETDVFSELPLAWLCAQPLLQQGDGQVGTAGAARIVLREKNRAEAVGDVETRIQRRGQVEQRIQEIVLLLAVRQPHPAVVLDRAN